MPFKPSEPGEFPTLGHDVAEWMTYYLAQPDRASYEPFRPYDEQYEFLLRFYELDPHTGKRKIQRGLLGRPRGWGKSPFSAALCAAEGLGPVLFSHWDEDGRPVGKPWAAVRTPLIQIAAVSEQQTMNTFEPLLEMLRESPRIAEDYPSLQAYDTQVLLPRGRIEQVTASPRSVKGARAVFAVMDQTEEWVRSNHGTKLAQVMRANAAKVGGAVLETPNAFIPGEESVAEAAAAEWDAIVAGTTPNKSLYRDHREAPADTDMWDRESLIHGLRVAYGCSSGHPGGCLVHPEGHDPAAPEHGHVDLDSIINTIWTKGQDAQQSRSDFLNQITHASDAWLSQPEWSACEDREKVVAPGDTIVLGFDGSRGRVRGNADATALVGMRVEDRHLFEIRVWEPREGDRDWSPNATEVDAEVRAAFDRYKVVGFYADPSGWQTHVAQWEAAFGRKLKIKASGNEPISMWPRGKNSKVTHITEAFHQAVVDGEISHDGGPSLRRHVLNARRRKSRGGGYLLYKEYPESPSKIDAAYASIMAFQACMDAQSKRIGSGRKRSGNGPRMMILK